MNLAQYQKEVVLTGREFGMLLLLWRRQGRKTTTFAWQALLWMLEHPGCLVTFATCSIALGSELTEREVQMLLSIVKSIRDGSGALKVESESDALPWYDVADLYTHNRLEVSIHHDRTVRSRTKIIAANYATARGYSGYVMLDEVGFIRDFKLFFEAVEPIFSANPAYRLWMATTPPEDDAHFSYELSAYPPGHIFTPNARGNWYTNDSGIPVHRVSAEDAELAGVHLYDSKSRGIVTPEQHRARALDKTAWDRNYGLVFTQGGISAVQLLPLSQAQAAGQRLGCRYYEDDLPDEWVDALDPNAETVVAIDPATTTKDKSNPTGISITQKIDSLYAAKVLFRGKSSDGMKWRKMLEDIVRRLQQRGIRVRCVLIDATSERFWAAETRDALHHLCPVELVVSSETITHMGETMKVKTYLGNIAVASIDDKMAARPPAREVREDFRLVRRFKGGFDNVVDNAGNHGDMFDGYKLTIHGFLTDFTECEAFAVQVGERTCEPRGADPTRMTLSPVDNDFDQPTILRV
jgi:hypothetical protein